MNAGEHRKKTPSDLRWAKTKLVLSGFSIMLGAGILTAIDLFTGFPIPARGPFTVFVSIPSAIFGWAVMKRGMTTTVADVCDLSELYNGKVNVALIVQTFRCQTREARALLDHMCQEGIFVATREAAETGLQVGYTGIGDDPNTLAEVQREQDHALNAALNADTKQREQEFLDALNQNKSPSLPDDLQTYALQTEFSHEGTETSGAHRKGTRSHNNRTGA